MSFFFCNSNSHNVLMFGGLESMIKLSVMSPNTRHSRGRVVPLTIDITVPMKMSSLSQLSAKRNCGVRGRQRWEGDSQQLRGLWVIDCDSA